MNMKNLGLALIAIAGFALGSAAADGGHPIKKTLKGTMHTTHIQRIPAHQCKKQHPVKQRLPISPRPAQLNQSK